MEILSGCEDILDNALHREYARNLGIALYKKLNEVYEHITGKKYPGNGWGCPVCNFNFVKKVAKYYFDEKQRLADEQKLMESLKPAKEVKTPKEKKPADKKTTTKTNKNTKKRK